MQQVDKHNKISLSELEIMSQRMFEKLVKAVIDIEKEIMIVDADFHADQEAFLLEQGSKQENLWGINIHPKEKIDHFIEFDSMINIRPSFGNRSRSVDDVKIQQKIKNLVYEWIKQ